MPPRRFDISLALLLLLITVGLVASGCDSTKKRSPRSNAAGRAAQQKASQQTALFNSVRSRLKTLPELTQMELTPPLVVLDARSTADGEDIEAVLVRRPEAPNEPANLLVVPRRNVRFREGARSGDIVKYYVKPDQDTIDRLREGGEVDIATFDAVDLIVAQVLRDDALLVQGGLPQEITQPAKVEIWRVADDRMQEIGRQWGEYVARREPPLAWHPSPDESAIEGLGERLNQWLRQTRLAGKKADASAWSRPGLLATLPEALTGDEKLKPYLSDEQLGAGYFAEHDSRQLQGAIWHRDIAAWARGSETTLLGVAAALFDWTVRNVQLLDPSETPPRWPWENLLLGQATAEGRAWVFAGLCEQQGITVAIVSVEADGAGRTLVGVLDGEQLRLFDPILGLPLPGPGDDSVATLKEIQADDSLLRRLDLADAPYPVTAEAAQAARVQVVASPLALSRRASAFEKKLTADDAVAAASDVDALAEKLGKAAGVTEVSLWPGPYQTLLDKLKAKPSQRRQAVREFLPFAWRPHLWRARGQHFRGLLGKADTKRDALAEEVNDHRAAQRYYMNPKVRPPDNRLAKVAGEKRDIYRAAKTYATLFLANLSYDGGSYKVSKNWLQNGIFDGQDAERFRPQVLYNLARAAEALGETDLAVESLEAIEGPMAPGAKLRAQRLKTAAEKAKEADQGDDE